METDTTTTDTDTAAPEGKPEPEQDTLGDAGKRALEAERKARKAAERRAAEAEAQIKQADDAGKTEVEKLQAEVAALREQATTAQARADRMEVAASHGLTLAQARRLVGANREELEADAAVMAEELGLVSDKDKGAPAGRPTEDLKAGASNTEDDAPDPAALADSILSSSF